MSIPTEWAVVRLRDIVLDTQPGFAQRPGEEEEEGATPQIRTHNVSPNGQIDLAGIKHVTLPGEEFDRYRLKPQDIIFNNTNSEEWVGKTALFEEEGMYVFSNHMTRIRVNKQFVEPEYLARYLHFLWRAGYSRQRSKRWVSQAAVDQSTLLEFKIPLPTLPEQQRIVAILRQADSLREKRRQTIAKIDEFLNSVFIEMFYGPQSENWPQETIENLTENKPNAIRTGPFGSQLLHSEFVNEGIAVLGIDNVVQNSFTWDERRFITKAKYEGLKRYRVFPGDILITIMGTCGRCAVVPDDIPLSISTKHLCSITLDQKRCLPFYLQACFLNHPKVLRRLGVSERGAVMPGLNMQIIKQLAVPLPPLSLQQKFTAIVLCFNQLRQQQQQAEHRTGNLFQSLQQLAFSGDLSSVWRNIHLRELAISAQIRDASLGQVNGKATNTEYTPTAHQELPHERYWLTNHLGEVQGFVWQALREWPGTLIPSEDLDTFRQGAEQMEQVEDASDHILRALSQLAGLGLIAQVSVPNQQGEYVVGYRGLREGERVLPADIQHALEPQR